MIPVVFSGGSGSRLWPISRTTYPKQFCEIFDEPLLQRTLKRLTPLGQPMIVTVKSLKVLTDRCMSHLGLPLDHVIYEPVARNTAPAVALLCHTFMQRGLKEEVVGVFPADHLVGQEEKFIEIVKLAENCALEGQVVTLGVLPSHPSTGFGYVDCEPAVYKNTNQYVVRRVKQFSEKPDFITAQKFLQSGHHFWNAGMFVFKVETMVHALMEHLPQLWSEVSQVKEDQSNLAEIYTKISPLSIDKGVMEKLSNQVCIPCDIAWSDLGSWDDYAKMTDMGFISRETNKAKTVSCSADGNFIFSVKDKTIAVVGLDDIFIVETPDALLVGKKGSSQDTKKIVEELEHKKDKSTLEHVFDHRPWGKYEILADDLDFKIKVISVNPGQQLSLQSHVRRSEHWVIVDGSGEVVVNDQILPVKVGSYVVIPIHAKHRIRNTGPKILRFVEVQTGDYFGEDDIQRYQDDYNRV